MSTGSRVRRRVWIAAMALGVPAAPAVAGTRYWELSTRDALAEGEAFDHVVLTAEDDLRLGPGAEAVRVDGERQIWALARSRDGAWYAGTASGKILRIEGGKAEVAFATEELLVTALLEGSDALLYAATIPNGKVFRRDNAGRWSLFASLPCKYVWALLADPERHLVAATGPEGKLVAIDAQGRSSVLYETGKENVLALARGRAGELYFGTANPGLLYRLATDGRATILRDFGENEVRVLRVAERRIYAGVNSGVKVSPANFLGAVRQAAQKAETKEGNPVAGSAPPETPPKAGAAGKSPPSAPTIRGAVFALAPDGRLEGQTEFPQSYITDLAETEAGLVVGTNNSGRVHRIDKTGRLALLWDFPENQVLALGVEAGRLAVVGTGDAASLHRVGDGPAASGQYRSKPFDAGFRAEWGALTWRGKGAPAFLTRSGNVSEPDATWSDWAPAAAAGALKVKSPPARFLQLRIDWTPEAAASVSGVTVAYLPENQRPRVLEVKVTDARPQGQPSPSAGAPAQGQPALPAILHVPLKKIAWRAEDPDGDPLVYRLAYRAVDNQVWIPLQREEPVGGAEFLWNTESVPDGRYVVRVEASDEKANAEERALRQSRESAPFTVDHRKPDVGLAIAWEGPVCRVRGKAEDALSPIARLEYALDGGDWRSIVPADLIFDDRVESFEFTLGPLAAGSHVLTVRAIDQQDNIGSASAVVTAP